jgi:lysozyme
MNAERIAIAQLKVDEGFRRFMYLCPAGYPTIGFGTRIDQGGEGVSESAAGQMLQEAVISRAIELLRLPWYRELDDARKAVVLNMSYQLGLHGVLKFKRMIAALEGKDFGRAADEMLESSWATQTPTRAKRLAGFMRTGTN